MLKKWEEDHFRKMFSEARALGIEIKRENIPLIVEAASFRKRSVRMKGDVKKGCPYYEIGVPCHPVADLNCFLCPCPEYENERLDGGCRISNSSGNIKKDRNLPLGEVWDCSNCSYAHSPIFVIRYVSAHFDELFEKYGSSKTKKA